MTQRNPYASLLLPVIIPYVIYMYDSMDGNAEAIVPPSTNRLPTKAVTRHPYRLQQKLETGPVIHNIMFILSVC